jgi:Xaa-Pro aminopeptidase
MINYKERIKKLRGYMNGEGIDMCFIPKSGEQSYLTGMPKGLYDPTYANSYGDWANGIFLFHDKIYFLVPEMLVNLGHVEHDKNGIIDEYITITEGVPVEEAVKKVLGSRAQRIRRVAVSKNTFSSTLINLRSIIPQVKFLSLEDYVNSLRMIKTDYEITKMKEAARLTDEVFSEIVPFLKKGISEIDIKAEIDHRVLKKGCEGNSFHTGVMISGGKNKTHWSNTTGNIIEEGCTVAFDFGVMKDGFCSDFGRTVYAGEPTKEMVKIHETVMKAQQLAIDSMLPGKITCEDLNMVARKYIKEKGYDDGFRHRLGHSIGRDVHEYPYLMPGYNEILQKNMTFTIEPSVIIDNKLLIRVEDVVAVGENGGVSLNNFSKDIIVI